MLEVRIKKRLPGFTLDVEFEAERGTLALLGASGCGKSLTLRCIAGLARPDEGRIVLGDRVLFDSQKRVNIHPRERRVGYLFQQYALFPNMTIAQNIASGVRLRNKADRMRIAREKIAAFHLTGLENKKPGQISGGEQQRTALARILVNEPEVLLLDEPFSALDDYLKWQLELELSARLREFEGPTVLVSHNRAEVYRMCDHVCVLSCGRSEAARGVRELFEAPSTLPASLISGCKNYSRVSRTNGTALYAGDWGVTLDAGREIPPGIDMIGVRAHYIRPAAPGDVNRITCRVSRVIDDVFSTIVMLDTPGGASGPSASGPSASGPSASGPSAGGSSANGYSALRMELSKDDWQRQGEPENIDVTIRPEDIMLLQSEQEKGW